MIRLVSVDEAQKIFTEIISEDYENSTSAELGLALSPNWDAYKLLEKHGVLYVIVAEHNGKPVGYACVTFSRSNHYDEYLANVDALWVMKKYRAKSSVGLSLLKAIERKAKSCNATLLNFHFQKPGNLNHILERFGYTQTDIVMSKRIDYGT